MTTGKSIDDRGGKVSGASSGVMGGPNPAKKQLRVGSNVCECSDCGEFFTGVKPFDKHLTYHPGTNRAPDCKTRAQMLGGGLQPNINGVWQTVTKVKP
jgi:hypothetical protein